MLRSRCQAPGYYPASWVDVGGKHPGEAEPPAYASLSDDSGVSVFIQRLLSGRKLKSVNRGRASPFYSSDFPVDLHLEEHSRCSNSVAL